LRRFIGVIMVQAEKQVLLDRFLGQLPSHLAARLAKAVEVDRLIGGTDLPHEELLQALRPQLREQSKAGRMSTPQRFFCRPFEDLLVNTLPKKKQKGRIARVSITPVWHWLANELIPERHKALTEEIGQAILASRDGEVAAKLEELWQTSAEALNAALANDMKLHEAARRLGSLVIAEDAAEIALLISGGSDLLRVQEKLPPRMATLGDAEIKLLRDAHDRLENTKPDLAPYVAVIAMARLDRPWEALHLAAVIAGKPTDTLISNTDLGIVGELLFSDLDTYIDRIVPARPASFDPNQLLEALGAFAELSSGMVKELAIRRNGKWGQRLTKARAQVSETMEVIIERAPREIHAALPVARVGGFAKGPQPLDLTRPPDPEKLARAMRYAHVLGHAKPFAVAAAFNAKLGEVTDELATTLRGHAEDLLREMRAAQPGMHADEHFSALMGLCSPILGESETAILRRRARVPAAG
jgi:hypothetical protein